MSYGYVMRTGKRGSYAYWYKDPSSGLLFKGLVPPANVIGSHKQQPQEPSATFTCVCPWQNIDTADHQQIQTREGVLYNKLGLTEVKATEEIESAGLLSAYDALLKMIHPKTRLRLQVVRELHVIVFGSLYSWAGKDRSVTISKPGANAFAWGPPQFIGQNLLEFERDYLLALTPTSPAQKDEVPLRAAKIISEMLAVHPFREGNGRVARLLGDWLAIQAGLPLVQYDFNSAKSRQDYIVAVQQGFVKNYVPLEAIIRNGLPLD